MGKTRTRSSSKTKRYRCRTSVAIRFHKQERSLVFGPASILSEAEYTELLANGDIMPGWFEEQEEDAFNFPSGESETEQ